MNVGHILLLIAAKYQANLCKINQLQSSTCKTGFQSTSAQTGLHKYHAGLDQDSAPLCFFK